MKRALPLLSFFALTIPVLPAQAQSEPNAALHRSALFRLGLGSCVYGPDSYGATKLHLEYAPQFGQHLRLGSRLAVVSGSKPYYFGEYSNDRTHKVRQSYQALNVEQEAYWVPFGINKAVEFSAGVGAFGGYCVHKAFAGSGFYLKEPFVGSPEFLFGYKTSDEQGFHAGYIASLNADVALNQARTWRVGGRVFLQNDTRANYLYGAQVLLAHAW